MVRVMKDKARLRNCPRVERPRRHHCQMQGGVLLRIQDQTGHSWGRW